MQFGRPRRYVSQVKSRRLAFSGSFFLARQPLGPPAPRAVLAHRVAVGGRRHSVLLRGCADELVSLDGRVRAWEASAPGRGGVSIIDLESSDPADLDQILESVAGTGPFDATSLHHRRLADIDDGVVQDTLNVILKYEGDINKAQKELSKLLIKSNKNV